ncbi:hypothetical protein BC833DRAFT_627590 [Globomyces pollinis-pini]|nr:hypothetical protein BC833DRAFT_627590 [Globomyces pollinis-pini]
MDSRNPQAIESLLNLNCTMEGNQNNDRLKSIQTTLRNQLAEHAAKAKTILLNEKYEEKSTRTTYAGPQKEYKSWCQKHYQDNFVYPERVLRFLTENVIGRTAKKREDKILNHEVYQMKDTKAGTKLKYSSVYPDGTCEKGYIFPDKTTVDRTLLQNSILEKYNASFLIEDLSDNDKSDQESTIRSVIGIHSIENYINSIVDLWNIQRQVWIFFIFINQ